MSQVPRQKLAPQLSVFAVSAKGASMPPPRPGRMRFLRRPARAGILFAAQSEFLPIVCSYPIVICVTSRANHSLSVTPVSFLPCSALTPVHPLITVASASNHRLEARKETEWIVVAVLGSGHILPVRVWGVDAHDLPFMQLASVKNLSSTGAVIQGMRRQIRPGEILEVQLDEEKAQFRVIWTGMQGTQCCRRNRLTEAGLRTLPLGRGAGLLQRDGGRRV